MVSAAGQGTTVTEREIQDVLIGEVWMCSGQSNMQWSVGQTYHGDLEALAGGARQAIVHLKFQRVTTLRAEVGDAFLGH